MRAILDPDGAENSTPIGLGSANEFAAYLGELASVVSARGTPDSRLRRIAELLRTRPGGPSATPMLTLEVRTFGGFQLRTRAGWKEGPPAKKGGHLIQRLLTSPSRTVTRDELIATYATELSTAQATHRLHLAASGARAYLNQCIGDVPIIRTTRVGYSLRDEVHVDSDLSRFTDEYHRREPHAYEVAVARYGGEFLAGENGDWIRPVRVRCAAMYVDMLVELAQNAFDSDDLRGALHYSLAAGGADRSHEGAARIAMRCFAALGQRGPILKEYESLQTYLREQFGAEASKETRALYYSLVR